jgi:hypothetical protein
MTRAIKRKAHALWESGVAVGQIALRCRISRESLLDLARLARWSPRDPSQLAEKRCAPLAQQVQRTVRIRRVPPGASGKPEV